MTWAYISPTNRFNSGKGRSCSEPQLRATITVLFKNGCPNTMWRKLISEAVAERIIAAAYARREEITIGTTGKVMNLLARLLPTPLLTRFWSRMMGKFR